MGWTKEGGRGLASARCGLPSPGLDADLCVFFLWYKYVNIGSSILLSGAFRLFFAVDVVRKPSCAHSVCVSYG